MNDKSLSSVYAKDKRCYSDWVGACIDAVSGSDVPLIFRKWAALSAIAAVLGRKCWYDQGEYKIRPNLFVVLVSPRNRGKSTSFNLPVEDVLHRLSTPIGSNSDSSWKKYIGPHNQPIHIVRDRLTTERLGQIMGKLCVPILCSTEIESESALTLLTDEFGTLVSRQDGNLQAFLTKAWDSRDFQEYHTKQAGTDIIKGPYLNWLAGATPTTLLENMPKNATKQGLLSRMILVYFEGAKIPNKTRTKGRTRQEVEWLARDLGRIGNIEGEFDWESRSFELNVQEWLNAGAPPALDDVLPGAEEYNGRRFAHLVKIAICLSASKRADRVIRESDWEEAKEWLFEVEAFLPALLQRFAFGEAGLMADELIEFIRKSGGVVRSSRLKQEALRRTHNSGEVDAILKTMEDSGLIVKEEAKTPKGKTIYRIAEDESGQKG